MTSLGVLSQGESTGMRVGLTTQPTRSNERTQRTRKRTCIATAPSPTQAAMKATIDMLAAVRIGLWWLAISARKQANSPTKAPTF